MTVQLAENPGLRTTAVLAALSPIAKGQAVASAPGAALGHQMAPALDGGSVAGVAYTGAEPGGAFTVVSDGWVLALATDGVALAVNDEVTPAAGGAFRRAVPGDWVAGRAWTSTSGGPGERFLVHLLPPGYVLI